MLSQCLPWVCLSGFMLDETLWDDVVANLPEQQSVECRSLTQGETIAAMADHIAMSMPEKAILIGFSLGGYVARSLAARYPDRVAGLVLIATSLREDTPAQRQAKLETLEVQRHLHFRGIGRGAIIKTLRPNNNHNELLIARIREMSQRLGFEVLQRQSLLDRSTPVAEKIACPTLIIAAEEDQMRSPDEQKELQQHIPQAQLVTVANSGHMIPLEQPQKLTRIIEQWVQTNCL